MNEENTVQMPLNDMYIDENNFSFDDLDSDMVVNHGTDAEMGVEKVDAEDLYEEDEISDLMDGEEDDSEESVEVEADEAEEAEEDEEEYEEEYEEDEEEEVDFEQYDITLPDGNVIKLHEAVKGYKDAAALEAERMAFEAEKDSFAVSNSAVKRALNLAKLEAERVIEDYNDFDWGALSREDPQAYVENREFLDKYRARHKEIIAEMDHVESKLNEEISTATRAKAAKANEILTRDIPGWNKDLYVDLMTYAVKELGMDEDFVVGTVDAGFFKSLHKAQQLDQGKRTVKAKLKRIGAPKKVVKASAKSNKVVNAKQANLKRKMASGQVDDTDLADIFGMLED